MKTLKRTQSAMILALTFAVASTAVSAAFLHAQPATVNSMTAQQQAAIAQVVIVGQRMTPEEKLAYDIAPLEVARVEIIGKRFSAQEKLLMTNADVATAKLSASHVKV